MQILLLEDHGESRTVITNLLTHWGHTVLGAESLETARTHMAGQLFDLLLSDIGLLDGDAYDLVKAAKEEHRIRCVVALTGRTAEEDRSRAREAGFDYYLTKPVDFHELRSLLGELDPQTSAQVSGLSPLLLGGSALGFTG